MPPCLAALHRMKYIYPLFTHNIIQNFEDIGVLVKTDKQVFFFLTRYGKINDIVGKGIADILLRNAMLKATLINLTLISVALGASSFHYANTTLK
jgi:hypothetical protein